MCQLIDKGTHGLLKAITVPRHLDFDLIIDEDPQNIEVLTHYMLMLSFHQQCKLESWSEMIRVAKHQLGGCWVTHFINRNLPPLLFLFLSASPMTCACILNMSSRWSARWSCSRVSRDSVAYKSHVRTWIAGYYAGYYAANMCLLIQI
jgi:hypothetical protein